MSVTELLKSAQFVTVGPGAEIAIVNRAVWDEIVSLLSDDQAWYWSNDWQAREQEADQNRVTGAYEEFESVDAFIASL